MASLFSVTGLSMVMLVHRMWSITKNLQEHRSQTNHIALHVKDGCFGNGWRVGSSLEQCRAWLGCQCLSPCVFLCALYCDSPAWTHAQLIQFNIRITNLTDVQVMREKLELEKKLETEQVWSWRGCGTESTVILLLTMLWCCQRSWLPNSISVLRTVLYDAHASSTHRIQAARFENALDVWFESCKPSQTHHPSNKSGTHMLKWLICLPSPD